jgi:hypothetical protein
MQRSLFSMRLTRPFAAALFVLTCLSPVQTATAGQRPTPGAQKSEPGPVPQANADETRNRLDDLLRQYPPSLGRILALDPTLLDNAPYLQPYPELAAFLAAHPDVKHNPGYFLANYERNPPWRQTPQDRAIEMWRNVVESITIASVIVIIASGLFWLLKTLIEYRRWSRLSKIQTEVHNKLLDRFTANEDLLSYIQTPAGRKFLESAPIPIDSPRSISAPLGRILWSAQVGAVLTVLGMGIEVVARSAIEDIAGPVAAIGAVIIALGIGFLVSAFLAYLLSRRFGLMNEPAAPETRG